MKKPKRAMMRKEPDLSKKTVMVLAVLVVLISIFGTWAVLQNTTKTVVRSSGPSWGTVALTIEGDSPPEKVTNDASLSINID